MKKKLIIFGYFNFMFLLSLFIGVTIASNTGAKTEIKYRDLEHEMTDTEVSYDVERGWFLFKFNPGQSYIKGYKIKETRQKYFLGWNTRVDTLQTYYKNNN